MSYTPHPDEIKAPPPQYSPNNPTNFGMPYQQVPPPGQPPHYGSPLPSIPVYTQPTVFVQPSGGFLSHYPQAVQCANCRQQVVTFVHYESGGATWLLALLICLFGGFLGCCLIPFCVPSCQDAVHTCPSCRAPIGRRGAF